MGECPGSYTLGVSDGGGLGKAGFLVEYAVLKKREGRKGYEGPTFRALFWEAGRNRLSPARKVGKKGSGDGKVKRAKKQKKPCNLDFRPVKGGEKEIHV